MISGEITACRVVLMTKLLSDVLLRKLILTGSSYHTHLVSSDLIYVSAQWQRSKATQLAVAATDRKEVGRAVRRHVPGCRVVLDRNGSVRFGSVQFL